MTSFDYSGTGIKKGRGPAQRSLDLIEAMQAVTRAAQPITGRGVGYKLFTQGLIPSMARSEIQRVYRLLKQAREQDIIPWEWIVDETRSIERVSTWADPAAYARCVARSYRRDFWDQQPHRVQVWSEKGTVRGVLAPVLDHYAVGFYPVHGFSSATAVHDVAEDDDGRDLIVLYVGDFDPSGMFMSEEDLPARFARYNGDHVELTRIALTVEQLEGLPSFLATDKRKDPRYKWFVANHGRHCWELDAMDPNDLRDCVEQEDPGADRACGVATVRGRQRSRAGKSADRPRTVGQVMKKIFRELRREFPFSEIEITNGNHLRLQLPNGRSVFASATPSDRRAMLNTRAEVRRQLKDRDEGGQP